MSFTGNLQRRSRVRLESWICSTVGTALLEEDRARIDPELKDFERPVDRTLQQSSKHSKSKSALSERRDIVGWFSKKEVVGEFVIRHYPNGEMVFHSTLNPNMTMVNFAYYLDKLVHDLGEIEGTRLWRSFLHGFGGVRDCSPQATCRWRTDSTRFRQLSRLCPHPLAGILWSRLDGWSKRVSGISVKRVVPLGPTRISKKQSSPAVRRYSYTFSIPDRKM
jgi:hypothetical protein